MLHIGLKEMNLSSACLEASRRGFGLFKLLSDVEQSKVHGHFYQHIYIVLLIA